MQSQSKKVEGILKNSRMNLRQTQNSARSSLLLLKINFYFFIFPLRRVSLLYHFLTIKRRRQ